MFTNESVIELLVEWLRGNPSRVEFLLLLLLNCELAQPNSSSICGFGIQTNGADDDDDCGGVGLTLSGVGWLNNHLSELVSLLTWARARSRHSS